MSKYKNRKAVIDGITFDSRKEADRYMELRLLEKAGEIQNLHRQVKFVLIPKQYSKTEFTKKGKQRLAEHECSYVADFVYKKGRETIVEDTKGYRTADYIIKRKLLLYMYGIRIKEI